MNEGENGLFHAEHQVEKVGENQYVGSTTAILPLSEPLPEANFKFHISSLSNVNNKEVVRGSWDYEVYAKATDDTTVQIVKALISHKDELSVQINQTTYTPFSFIVNYGEQVYSETLKRRKHIV